MPKKQSTIAHSTNMHNIKDVVAFGKYLERMAAQKRRVFHDGQWHSDPLQLKRQLGL